MMQFLGNVLNLYIRFFDSNFYMIYLLPFLCFFVLISIVKVVWYLVRFN